MSHQEPQDLSLPEALPPELEALSRRLDALAEGDARSAPAGLEDRVFAASRGGLNAGRLTLVGDPAELRRTARVGGSWWSATPMRLAAGLALMTVAGVAALLTIRPPVSPVGVTPHVAADLDAVRLDLALDVAMGDEKVTKEIDHLYSEVERLSRTLEGEPVEDVATESL